jgi:hypothetical protein
MAGLKLLTTEEVADRLTRAGVRTSARTLETWRRKGTGPEYIRIERRVRYRPAAVREFLTRDEPNAAGTAA